MRITYSKALDAAVRAVTHPGTIDEWVARRKLERALRPLLSDAARAHLDSRAA